MRTLLSTTALALALLLAGPAAVHAQGSAGSDDQGGTTGTMTSTPNDAADDAIGTRGGEVGRPYDDEERRRYGRSEYDRGYEAGRQEAERYYGGRSEYERGYRMGRSEAEREGYYRDRDRDRRPYYGRRGYGDEGYDRRYGGGYGERDDWF